MQASLYYTQFPQTWRHFSLPRLPQLPSPKAHMRHSRSFLLGIAQGCSDSLQSMRVRRFNHLAKYFTNIVRNGKPADLECPKEANFQEKYEKLEVTSL
jgi:hypothetical protein